MADLQQRLSRPQSLSPPPTDSSDRTEIEKEIEEKSGSDGEEVLGRLSIWSIGGMIGFLGWTGIRRWRAGRIGKSSKLV
jgi:hypothetical protein